MNINQAIALRTSRRQYAPESMEQDDLKTLTKLVKTLNRLSGLNLTLIEDAREAFASFSKSYGLLKGVRTVLVLKGPAADVDLDEKLGYFGELFVLEATMMGLGTCWVGGTYDRRSPLFELASGESLRGVITVGPIAHTPTFREKMITAFTHRQSKPLELFYTATAPAPEWFLTAAESVKAAPSAINAQPVRLHYTPEHVEIYVRDPKDYQLMDLGIAKAHFELVSGKRFTRGNPGKTIL